MVVIWATLVAFMALVSGLMVGVSWSAYFVAVGLIITAVFYAIVLPMEEPTNSGS